MTEPKAQGGPASAETRATIAMALAELAFSGQVASLLLS